MAAAAAQYQASRSRQSQDAVSQSATPVPGTEEGDVDTEMKDAANTEVEAQVSSILTLKSSNPNPAL
jgi:hypothetical protein